MSKTYSYYGFTVKIRALGDDESVPPVPTLIQIILDSAAWSVIEKERKRKLDESRNRRRRNKKGVFDANGQRKEGLQDNT